MECSCLDYSFLKSKWFYFFVVLAFTTFWYYKLIALVKDNCDAVIQARRFVAMLLPVLVIIFILSLPINENRHLEEMVRDLISSIEHINTIAFCSPILLVFLSMWINRLKTQFFDKNSQNKIVNAVCTVLRHETINTLFIMLASFVICLVIWLAFLGHQNFVHLVVFGSFFGASLSVIVCGFTRR